MIGAVADVLEPDWEKAPATVDRFLVAAVGEYMPVPMVNCQLVNGWQFGSPASSLATETASLELYRVSAPRSWRDSWMLLRALLAMMSW